MIDWVDVGGWRGDAAAALVTGPGAYDSKGIFSGTGHAANLQGEVDGTLAFLYASVSALPTAWNIPYIPKTESQSFALSHNGGKTWEKYPGNPIMVDPPSGWNITGWRDPFYLPWPEMDILLNKTEPHWYMVMGSGIRGVGPRIPFYSAPARNLTQWTFLGALWEPKNNETFGNVLETGSYGFNFEVSGFFSLVGYIFLPRTGLYGGNEDWRCRKISREMITSLLLWELRAVASPDTAVGLYGRRER